MSLRIFILGVATTILSAGLAPPAGAQVWQPFGPVNYRHDFAPFETFDIKNMSSAPDPQEGYFFTFDKLNWVVSSEGTPIGNPDVVAFFPDIFREIDPPQVFNGITDGVPEATFGWGERYEFGYVVDHHGWAVSVLDGPDISDVEVYGFIDSLLDHPLNDAPVLIEQGNPASGNVIILFEADPRLLQGFLAADTNRDGIYDLPVDINEDLFLTADDLITFLTSFDQVTARNSVELDGVEVMKTYRFKPTHQGTVVEFSYGARYLRLHDNFRVDALGGFLNDYNMLGDTENVTPTAAAPVDSGTSFWDTTIDNHIVGPQVALKWSKRQGRFTYHAGGRFTFGYNIQEHDQVGQIGTALDLGYHEDVTIQEIVVDADGDEIPVGSFAEPRFRGQPIFLSNNAIRHGKQEDEFSPLVEFRTGLNYHLTQDFALTLGANVTFIDNVRRAAPNVAYVLPSMGFVNGGTQEILAAGVNFGVEFNR